MEKVRAYIECNKSGVYSVYTEGSLPFGVTSEGLSLEEAKGDFVQVYEAMRRAFLDRTGVLVDVSFEFVLDASALLRALPHGWGLSEVARRVGVSCRRLWQYKQGKRRPQAQRQELLRSIMQA